MTDTTDVIFKRWPNGDVIAIFPAIPAGSSPALCSSFEHVGQHGAVDVGAMAKIRPASPAEYADLKRELEAWPYDYRLRVVRRFMRAHQRAREAMTSRELAVFQLAKHSPFSPGEITKLHGEDDWRRP